MDKPFHVYASDGFESAHKSEAAAIRAAKRGQRTRGASVGYTVRKCDAYGLTGGGHGTMVYATGRYEVLVCGDIHARCRTLEEARRIARELDDGSTPGDGAPSVYDTQEDRWVRWE